MSVEQSLLHGPVAELVDGVRDSARPLNPVRTVLLGSTARREHSYGSLSGREELYGDLEFYVMVNGPIPGGAVHEFGERVRQLEREAGYENPFFHVETAVRDNLGFWLRFPLDVRVASLELVRSGEVIEGKPLPRDHPFARLRWLDRGAMRQVAVTRLWLQYLHFPIQMLEGDECGWEREILKLSLCRNLLDALTVLLPEQGVLLTDYRSRLQAIERDASLVEALGPDAVEIQRSALRGKLDLTFDQDLDELYEAFIRQFARLLLRLVGLPVSGRAGVDEVAERAVGELLARKRDFAVPGPLLRLRRAPRKTRTLRALARGEGGLVRAIEFIRTPKLNLIAALLLLEHQRLLRHIRGRSSEPDQRVEVILQRLGGGAPLADDDSVGSYMTIAQVVAMALKGPTEAGSLDPWLQWRHAHGGVG